MTGRPPVAAAAANWPADLPAWTARLESFFESADWARLIEFVASERETEIVFPRPDEVFNAFVLTPYEEVKVVILGQDPYHGEGQAHGLSFSVRDGVKHPPSLRNIFKELESDLGFPPPVSGDLTNWAKQGVFLLNTVLTVRQGAAHSHRNRGWEVFTNHVIDCLNQHPRDLVFLLWGNAAQQMGPRLDPRHPVIGSPHPSPLSAHRGFFGSRPFSECNRALEQSGQSPINWRL